MICSTVCNNNNTRAQQRVLRPTTGNRERKGEASGPHLRAQHAKQHLDGQLKVREVVIAMRERQRDCAQAGSTRGTVCSLTMTATRRTSTHPNRRQA
jgi:hypothetical protein